MHVGGVVALSGCTRVRSWPWARPRAPCGLSLRTAALCVVAATLGSITLPQARAHESSASWASPMLSPSASPTASPSAHPSASPTPSATSGPSANPIASASPTTAADPSATPSSAPTDSPSAPPSTESQHGTSLAPTPTAAHHTSTPAHGVPHGSHHGGDGGQGAAHGGEAAHGCADGNDTEHGHGHGEGHGHGDHVIHEGHEPHEGVAQLLEGHPGMTVAFILVAIGITIVLELSRHKLDHTVEHRAHRSKFWAHIQDILQALYKELTILGLVAYIMFALEQGVFKTGWFQQLMKTHAATHAATSPAEMLHLSTEIFEVVHMSMFAIMVMVLAMVTVLTVGGHLIAKRWARWANEFAADGGRFSTAMAAPEFNKKKKQKSCQFVRNLANSRKNQHDLFDSCLSMARTAGVEDTTQVTDEMVACLFEDIVGLVEIGPTVLMFYAIMATLAWLRLRFVPILVWQTFWAAVQVFAMGLLSLVSPTTPWHAVARMV